MPKYSLVVVSNRLPVSVVKTGDTLTFESSSGGLATAMSSLKQTDKIWVGWPGIASDNLTDDDKDQIVTELSKHGCYPVFLSAAQIELFYEGFSNDTLWPLFHYFQSLTRHKNEYWEAYQEVNALFAQAASEVVEDTGSVWVHDYHLMTMPAMLRAINPSASIGFFLHIPFPSYEIYRLLPQRKEVLEGLLGADLIGFHVYDYARHFLSSCLRLLGINSHQGIMEYEGRVIKTDAFPIGIDYEKFRATLTTVGTKKAIAELDSMYGKDLKLILSVDRLDYSKGIPERLEAFRILLHDYPQWRGKVRMQMVAVPSRVEVQTYQELRDTIEQTVSRINGEYGTVNWAPISYQFQNRPFEEVVALYAAADVALVTPIRDGMNLVAKEYVASKHNRPGVLILSEMTGAIDELPEAISINPSNTRSVAEAMNQALTMSKREQMHRLSDMQRRLKLNTVQAWGSNFLGDLQSMNGSEGQHYKSMSDESRLELLAAYKAAQSRLIILDYDGTLKNFVSSPRAILAKPSIKLRRLLKRLADDERNQVAIVSGRPKKALDKWFRGTPLTLIAEHGAWSKYDSKWTKSDADFKHVKKKLKPILQRYVGRTAGAEIEEKDYSLVWHYRNVAPELAYVRANEMKRELIDALGSEEIGVHTGDKVIEIKPLSINKGYAAAELDALYQSEFILAAGDDYTDEDMFHELPNDSYTIKIGSGSTKANYQLASVEELTRLLEDVSMLKND